MIYGDIWPFPTKTINKLGRIANNIIDIEQNATGQLESLINEKTSTKCSHRILKYDGRPFNADEIVERIICQIEL